MLAGQNDESGSAEPGADKGLLAPVPGDPARPSIGIFHLYVHDRCCSDALEEEPAGGAAGRTFRTARANSNLFRKIVGRAESVVFRIAPLTRRRADARMTSLSGSPRCASAVLDAAKFDDCPLTGAIGMRLRTRSSRMHEGGWRRPAASVPSRSARCRSSLEGIDAEVRAPGRSTARDRLHQWQPEGGPTWRWPISHSSV